MSSRDFNLVAQLAAMDARLIRMERELQAVKAENLGLKQELETVKNGNLALQRRMFLLEDSELKFEENFDDIKSWIQGFDDFQYSADEAAIQREQEQLREADPRAPRW